MANETVIQEIAHDYQPLFDLMYNEHGLLLTISEMNEIIRASKKVVDNINESIK